MSDMNTTCCSKVAGLADDVGLPTFRAFNFCPYCGLPLKPLKHYWGAAEYEAPKTSDQVLQRIKIYMAEKVRWMEKKAKGLYRTDQSSWRSLTDRIHDFNNVLYLLTNEETVLKRSIAAAEAADAARGK